MQRLASIGAFIALLTCALLSSPVFSAPASASTPDVTAPVATGLAGSPTSFSPDSDGYQDSSRISLTLSEAAWVTMDVRTQGGTWLKTLINSARPAGAVKSSWNGKNSAGQVVSDGAYFIRLLLTDAAGNTSTYQTKVTVNRTLQKMSTGFPYFSPNGDKRQDGTNVKYTLVRTSQIKVTVKSTSGTNVATIYDNSQNAGRKVVAWNGRTINNRWAWQGGYVITVTATNWLGTTQRSLTVRADKTRPVIDKVIDTAAIAPFVDKHRDKVGISFRSSEPGALSVKIVDPWGRTVRNGSIGARKAGWNKWWWNGTNRLGVTMPAGKYKYTFSMTDRAGNRGASVTRIIPVSNYIKAENVDYKIQKIVIKLGTQTLTAYDSSGKWRFSILISSGKQGSGTPAGTYRVQSKKRTLIARSLNVFAAYPSYFKPHYAIHGWPYASGGRQLRGVLGRPASHGCVRSEDPYAKFIQQRTRIGSTTVRIVR